MRALLFAAWFVAPACAAACVQSSLDQLVEAIPKARIEHRATLAGRGLQLACPDWPAPLVKGLRDLAMVSPDMRALIEAKAIAEAPASWMAACPGGLAALTRVTQMPASQKRSHLYRACRLARFKFATAAEFDAGKGALLLPIAVAGLLSKVRLKAPQRRAILRALAGVGTAKDVERAALDRLIVPPMRRLEIPRIEPPPEPPPPPPPPMFERLEVQRISLGSGCPSDRASAVITAMVQAARGCPSSPSRTATLVRLSLTVDATGAVSAIRVTDGALGPEAFAACFTTGLSQARLPAAPTGCALTVEALRPK